MLHKQKLYTHVVLIVDWEDQAQLYAFGAAPAQWTVYCVMFPKSNAFHLDTAAWNCHTCVTISWQPMPCLAVCDMNPLPFQCTNPRCSWFALPYQNEHQFLVSHRTLGTFTYKGCVPCLFSWIDPPAACKVHQADTPYPELAGVLFVNAEGQTAIAAAHDWQVATTLGYQTCLVRATINDALFQYPKIQNELPNVNAIGHIELDFAASWVEGNPAGLASFFVFSL